MFLIVMLNCLLFVHANFASFQFGTNYSFMISSLQSENLMLAHKQKAEKEQNNQLKNQVAHLLQLEQEQKMQIHERDLTIKSLQVKLGVSVYFKFCLL